MKERKLERRNMRAERIRGNALSDIEREFAKDPKKLALAQHMLDIGLPFASKIESDYTDKKALKLRKREERKRISDHLEANKGNPKEFGFGFIGSAIFYFIAKEVAIYVAKVIIEWLLFGDDDD